MLVAKILSVLACAVAMASAEPTVIHGEAKGAIPNIFMVEVDSSECSGVFVSFWQFSSIVKTHDVFSHRTAVANPESFVAEELSKKGVPASDYKIRFAVNTQLYKGVSVQLANRESSDELVKSIASKTIHRVSLRSAPAPVKVEAAKLPAEAIHALTGVNEVRKKFGLSGQGIKVAVIDSGIYYTHPALGGGFGPGFKVGYGDYYGAENLTAIYPDPDPFDDCTSVSHGTHVAGIIGANAYNLTRFSDPLFRPPVPFTGVAPNVIIGGYRVFGCAEDTTSTDIIAAAIFKAAEDGSDIINLSLGGGPVYADGADAYAAEVVGSQGVIVVASNGNEQASGLMTAGSPGISRGGLGIASFDNVNVNQPYLTVDGTRFPYGAGSANGNFNFNNPVEIVANDLDAERNDVQDDGTTDDIKVNATGKALLIRWGSVSGSSRRCNYAIRAGAVACIIYSNEASIPGILGAAGVPSLATTNEAGRAILAALRANKKPRFIVTNQRQNFDVPTAGTVSDFSSPGLDPELFIKPDLGGIGGEVLSTVSRNVANNAKSFAYSVYSGTSMSAPYVAGALALFLEAKGIKKFDFPTTRAILQNTAKPAKIFRSGLIDSVTRQGAGLINIHKAITTKTIITPSALHLNDTKHTSQHYILTVRNTDTVPVSYTVGTMGAAMATGFVPGDDALQMISSTSFTEDYADVKFAKNNDRVPNLDITVPAGGSRNVHVHFKAPENAIAGLFPVYSGYITITYQGEAEPIASVPYAGMVGNWRDAAIFAKVSPAYATAFVQPLLTTPVNNVTSLTNAYSLAISPEDGSVALSPLSTTVPTVINATADGLGFLPIYATSSRFAKAELIFAGSDAEKRLLPGNIRHKTPLGYAVSTALDTFTTAPYILTEVPRTAPQLGGVALPTVYAWNGVIVTNAMNVSEETLVQLPAGSYRFKLSGLKHWGRVGAAGDSNYDVVLSPVFRLVY
ncbi:hypothetical protein HDU67_005557 [Dinochytrium kinnereticum]|nr:hypothetical protein HDU67_005557 [Dinochytrium kinnereticum]